MKAWQVVNLMLEAERPSVVDRMSVYIFGPGLPKDGYVAKSVSQAIAHLRHFGILAKGLKNSAGNAPMDAHNPDDAGAALDTLVDDGYVFIIKNGPGDIEVLGSAIPVQTTPEGKQKAEQFLGLDKHEAVAHRKHLKDSTKRLHVDYVLHGSKETENAEKAAADNATGAEQTRQQTAQAQEQNAARTHVPPEKDSDFPPTPAAWSVGGKPVYFGFTFENNSKNGIEITAVADKSPAAQAGLQAGDIVHTSGKFMLANGELSKSWWIKNPKQLKDALYWMRPGVVVPFGVLRGSERLWIPIAPQGQPTANATPQPPQASAPATPQPNPPQPQSTTGSTKANVSSLT